METSEVKRRLAEIENIDDEELRETVYEIFEEEAPDYLWKVAASSSGKYHPKDTTGEKGLWIHLKRSYVMYERLARSYEFQDKITEEELDYGRAAILLHDIFKRGFEEKDHTDDYHDIMAAVRLREEYDLPGEVIDCILTHNGPFGSGRRPQNDLEQVHHLADMVASERKNYTELEDYPEELEGIAFRREEEE